MKHSILILGLILSLNLFGQDLARKEMKYKPKDFNESLTQLDRIIPDSTKTKIKSMTENDFIAQTHFSTGMWIRNNWLYDRYLFGLIVTKSDLRKDLTAKGLFHNDDMSSVILCSFHRQLNNVDINIEQQIKEIHQQYKNLNDPQWRAEQDSLYYLNLMTKFNVNDTLYRQFLYDRNWLGEARKSAIISVRVIDKSLNKLKVDVVSFGEEKDKSLIFEQMDCDSSDCWIDPHWWQHGKIELR
jgi:hypothetical protein